MWGRYGEIVEEELQLAHLLAVVRLHRAHPLPRRPRAPPARPRALGLDLPRVHGLPHRARAAEYLQG